MPLIMESPTVEVPRANVRPHDAPFDPGKFITVEDVPIFREHETTSRETGEDLKFGEKELRKIVDRCNQRIEETGDYAAITFGHTSDEQNDPQPDLAGFAGPFKIGLLGYGDKESYCILCDMHIYNDEKERFEKSPRRSPELWLENGYEGMFLDPIALLGAEPPRLDMGLTMYSLRRSGRKVERYMAASPGAANAYIPNATLRDKHSMAESTERKSDMALQPEDIKYLIDAFMNTDVMKQVQQLITESQGVNQTEGLDAGPPIKPEADTGLGAEGIEEPEIPPEAPMDDGPDVPPPTDDTPGPAFGDEDEDMEEYGYRRGRQPHRSGSRGSRSRTRKYGADDTENLEDDEDKDKNMPEKYSQYDPRSVAQRIKDLEAQLEIEKGKRVDTERYSLLEQRRRIRVFDMDKEFARCRYSKMDGDGFKEHIEMIDENFTPIPDGTEIPRGLLTTKFQGPDIPVEKYSSEQNDRALQHCQRQRAKGINIEYSDALTDVVAGRDVAE